MSPFERVSFFTQHDLFADFFPVYFQACKDASPVKSGVYQLAFASLAPAAIVAGLSVKATERYRPQMWIAWTLVIVALGLMSTLLATDSLGKSTGCLVLLGLGIGYVVFVDRGLSWSNTPTLTHGSILQTTTMYPIQSPLPVTQNATALSFMWFLRVFATVNISRALPSSILILSALGVGCHHWEHCSPERARKKASCIFFPVRRKHDYVRTYPRAPHAFSTG